MTEHYMIEKSVRKNSAVRASYNELTAKTFGFTFEEWYGRGYWSSKNIPYALCDGTRVISNVSVNPMDIVWDGEIRRYVQLGTVMTDPEYRGRGLSRLLIGEVLKDWRDRCDAMFLFANDSVLEFYPEFGFVREQLHQFRRPVIPHPGRSLTGKTARCFCRAAKKISGRDVSSHFLPYSIRSYRSQL